MYKRTPRMSIITLFAVISLMLCEQTISESSLGIRDVDDSSKRLNEHFVNTVVIILD